MYSTAVRLLLYQGENGSACDCELTSSLKEQCVVQESLVFRVLQGTEMANAMFLQRHNSWLSSPILQIGRNSLENRLLQYGTKDHFFKAAICHFCQSPLEARVRASFIVLCLGVSKEPLMRIQPLVLFANCSAILILRL